MRFFKHLKVVIKHKTFVFLYACKLGIPGRGFLHDFPKFTPTEFFRSVKYFQGDKSPTIAERKAESGYSKISVHHSNRNFHHWQAWVDYSPTGFVIKRIDYKYALEYVADILAATRTYRGKSFCYQDTLDYFVPRTANYLMHPQTKEFIITLVQLIKNEGFKAVKRKKTKNIFRELENKYSLIIEIPFSNFNLSELDIKQTNQNHKV